MIKDVVIMLCGIAIVILTCIFVFCCVMLFCGCTISFTNISTHGTASDLVDEEQTASPDVKTDLSLPVIP